MGSVRVGLSLPREMVDTIDALADKEERTRANYILWVLKKHLEDMDRRTEEDREGV